MKGINMKKILGKFSIGEKRSQLILNIVILLLINVIVIGFNLRLDLTRNNTYSLSSKSKEIVSTLKENLKIRILFSKNLPAEHSSVFRYLKDLLEEYSYHGNRYFSYEIVDDEKELEKQARDFGIEAVTSREYVDDQIKLRRTYMGIVLQHADLMEKIESVTGTVGLEYQITSLIEKMSGKVDGLLKLKNPISLKLYLDSRLKALPINGIDKLDAKVQEAVSKCNLRNYDKIKYQLVDPSVDTAEAAASEVYGLHKLKWGGGKTRSGKYIKAGEGILGMVLIADDKHEIFDINVAPSLFGNVIVGADDLENKINDAVSVLISSSEKIGYVTGHGIAALNNSQDRDGSGAFKEILSDMYGVEEINLTEKDIPSNIKVLIVNGPKEKFSDEELFKIDQFLMLGKSALFFLDSYQEVQMDQQQQFMGRQPSAVPVNTGLEKLLKHYGVTVNKDFVLDKNCTKANMGNMIKDYPLVPIIKYSGFNSDLAATKYLKTAVFIKASSVDVDSKKLEEKGVASYNLVSSSDESWLMTGNINFNPYFMDSSKAKDFKSYPLAVLLSGEFESYFNKKGIPPSISSGTKGRIKSVKKLDNTVQAGKTNIIVIGTSEITKTEFIGNARKILARGSRGEVSSNDIFLHSMVDYLSGNEYVAEMKSKSIDYNPLEKISDQGRLYLKAINIAGVPFLIIIFGLLTLRRRSSRKKKIMKEFSEEA